jgi:hypothetical protein
MSSLLNDVVIDEISHESQSVIDACKVHLLIALDVANKAMPGDAFIAALYGLLLHKTDDKRMANGTGHSKRILSEVGNRPVTHSQRMVW